MHSYFVVAIWQCDAVKRIIDIFAPRRVDRAHIEMPKVPPSGNFSVVRPPVFAFRRQAVEHFLGEWPHVDIELMEDHVCLSVDAPFLADNLDELAEWERTVLWPFSDTNDQALLLERLWLLAFDEDLWQLTVVWHEHAIVLSNVVICDAIGFLERF